MRSAVVHTGARSGSTFLHIEYGSDSEDSEQVQIIEMPRITYPLEYQKLKDQYSRLREAADIKPLTEGDRIDVNSFLSETFGYLNEYEKAFVAGCSAQMHHFKKQIEKNFAELDEYKLI